jgi:cholesterol transport system auxiliary component
MSAHRNAARNAFACLVLTLPLAGCGDILPKAEPMSLITPQVHVDPDATWPQVTWQLGVARPTSGDMLDSRRMVVIPAAGQIEVYKGVSWDNAVPDIVQDAVVHAFEDSGKILAVGRQTSGMSADYMLLLELRDDQAVYRTASSPPEVTLVVNAKLIDYANSRAVASHTFRETVPATGTAVPAVAQAFDAAHTAFAREVVGWTLSSGQQAKAASEAAKH